MGQVGGEIGQVFGTWGMVAFLGWDTILNREKSWGVYGVDVG